MPLLGIQIQQTFVHIEPGLIMVFVQCLSECAVESVGYKPGFLVFFLIAFLFVIIADFCCLLVQFVTSIECPYTEQIQRKFEEQEPFPVEADLSVMSYDSEQDSEESKCHYKRFREIFEMTVEKSSDNIDDVHSLSVL
jgi:hypothetical protein